MPRLELFQVAESFSVDAATNRLSIFNLIENITAPTFPATIPVLTVIAVFVRLDTDGDRQFEVTLSTTVPGPLPVGPIQNRFAMQKVRHRTIFQITGVPLGAAGEFKAELFLGNDSVGVIRIPVTAQIVPVGSIGTPPPAARG